MKYNNCSSQRFESGFELNQLINKRNLDSYETKLLNFVVAKIDDFKRGSFPESLWDRSFEIVRTEIWSTEPGNEGGTDRRSLYRSRQGNSSS